MSKRGPATAIISIAQQARPKLSGQMEFARAQFTMLSMVVNRTPRSTSSRVRSSSLRMFISPDGEVLSMRSRSCACGVCAGLASVRNGGGALGSVMDGVPARTGVRRNLLRAWSPGRPSRGHSHSRARFLSR